MKTLFFTNSIAFFLLALAFPCQAQYGLMDIDISKAGNPLKLAQAGGLNAPQLSEIDLNNDGIKDLLVYDRSAQIALTFLNGGTPGQSDYSYAPEYMERFPQRSRNFMLARDYDCDGIEDLFFFNDVIGTTGGIGVWKGSYDTEGMIEFTEVEDLIFFEYLPGNWQKIFIYNPDLPAIDDIDGDGDIDVVAFTLDFIFQNNIYYYRNMSAENGYGCDSLIFKLEHQCYGMFSESGSDNTVLLSSGVDTCEGNIYWRNLANEGGARHTGSTLTTVDYNGDGVKDLAMGDVNLKNLNMITNNTVNDTFLAISQDAAYPSYDLPVDLFSMPGAYFLDVNNDGAQDMLAAPNEINWASSVTDSVVWFYENIQNNNDMIFEFRQKDFIVGDMVDLGQNANPAFFDYNADGLLDILVGNLAYCQDGGSFEYGLALFENVGTATEPAFDLVTNNYADLDSLAMYNFHPTFGDLNNDGDVDMLLGNAFGTLYYFENKAGAGNTASWAMSSTAYAGIDVGDNSSPQLVDLDEDGDLDIVVGEEAGNINYFENTGDATSAIFSSSPTSATIGLIDINTMGSGTSAPFFYKDTTWKMFIGHMLGGLIQMGNIDGNILGTYDTLSMDVEGMYTGMFSKVAVADLTGNDTMEVLVGNVRGGFSIFKLPPPEDSIVSAKPIITENQSVLVFPNPATDLLNISLPVANLQSIEFRVYNALGQLFIHQRQESFQKIHSLNIADLASGVYWLELREVGQRPKSIRFMVR